MANIYGANRASSKVASAINGTVLNIGRFETTIQLENGGQVSFIRFTPNGIKVGDEVAVAIVKVLR